ncbi:hypothetical protein PTKIN_Ptkin17bG0144300 [Pterospermum kingtungense]
MGSNESTSRSRRRKNGDENENDDHSLMSTLISGSEGEKVPAGSVLAVLALALVVLAVVFIVGVVVLASSSEDSSERKTMKAPGRNYRIYRDDFEDDPSSYFRALRNGSD